jgi:hypothetical protein
MRMIDHSMSLMTHPALQTALAHQARIQIDLSAELAIGLEHCLIVDSIPHTKGRVLLVVLLIDLSDLPPAVVGSTALASFGQAA